MIRGLRLFALASIILTGTLFCVAQSTTQQTADAQPATDVWDGLVARGSEAMKNGDFVAAEKLYRESLAYAEQHNLGTDYVVESNDEIGWSLREQRKFAESEILCRQNLELARTAYAENDVRVLKAKTGLGNSLAGLGQYQPAEDILLDALNGYEARSTSTACELSHVLNSLTVLYQSTHQYKKGEYILTDVFALLAGKRGTPCENFSILLTNLANLYSENHQWEEVEKIQRGRASLVLGMSGQNTELYGDALFGIAKAVAEENRPAEAADMFAQAASIYRNLSPPAWAKVADSLFYEENNLNFAGKPEQANRVHQEMLAIAANSDKGKARQEMMSWRSRGIEARRDGNLQQAAAFVAQEVGASRKLTAADQMIALGDSADVHEALKQSTEAEADLKEILTLSIAAAGPNSLSTANAYGELGSFYRKQRRLAEAEEAFATALPLYRPQDTNELERVLRALMWVYQQEGKYEQAETIAQRYVKLTEDTHNDLFLSVAWQNLANIYAKTNRPNDAEAAFVRALGVADRLQGPMHMQWASIALSEAAFYEQTGRPQEAERVYLSVIPFMEKEGGANLATLRIPLDGLIALLKSQGRLADAAKYEAQRDALPKMVPLPGSTP